jgi:protein-tyrosine phosphatase/nicotinamidase-related amidase
MHAVLLTQSVQVDMVAPIGRFDALPNRLHVGYAEARRLMGEDPANGPLARVMRWAYRQPDEVLRVVHLRDWHDPNDPRQTDHLQQFGPHCIAGTPGARFAFPEPASDKQIDVIDALTLNDFLDTPLASRLDPSRGQPLRVGIVGVWTEAKVSFLAYELRTRYPEFQVAVCSALTASSSRAHHFAALDQLQRLLGVRVIDSVTAFLAFLGGEADTPAVAPDAMFPTIDVDIPLPDADRTLVRALFRDCRSVRLKPLGGGFSGNRVFSTVSVDLHGREQVPHVLKIGDHTSMGKERASFERVQGVLGNNAPSIADFADFADRGAIKYRYASMGGAFSTTFQARFQRGAPDAEVDRVLDTVFGEQLARFYRAATLEAVDLLEHYGFHLASPERVRARVEELLGGPAPGATIEVRPGAIVPNPCRFYEQTLPKLPARPQDATWMAWVHGDLNGQNIVLDGHANVWLIDFFHTRQAHVLMDLIKLENDLLYLFTPIASEGDLAAGFAITDALLGVEDLAAPLPEACPVPGFERSWRTIRKLRSFYPALVQSDRDPFQLWVASLRYAVHTLSFDEPNRLQRTWALYAAGRLAGRVEAALSTWTRLRVDWVTAWPGAGKVGLTLLPGRRDLGRHLTDDLAAAREQGVARLLCLVPTDELDRYGVADLLDVAAAAGLETCQIPIADQRPCSPEDAARAVAFLDAADGRDTLVHCVGGLGRSGMIVAHALVGRGFSPDQAIAAVRAARGPRAVETASQVAFVRGERSPR